MDSRIKSIIEKRKKLGWSTQSLAKKAGMPYAHVLWAEDGYRFEEYPAGYWDELVSRLIDTLKFYLQKEQRQKLHVRKRGPVSKILTKDYLISEYSLKKKSINDIAKNCNCSRQYVYYKLKEYNIPTRSKHSARKLALDREK